MALHRNGDRHDSNLFKTETHEILRPGRTLVEALEKETNERYAKAGIFFPNRGRGMHMMVIQWDVTG